MEKNDLITKFFNKKLMTTPATLRVYRYNIQTYFKDLNKDMNTYFNNGNTLETIEDDLRTVYHIENKKGRPKYSMKTFFAGIKQFLICNNKELKDIEFWESLKTQTKGCLPFYDKGILNNEDIKTILSHGNTLSRALFLMLASSGRRIGEILALTPEDINTNNKPTTLNIKKGMTRNQTKTGQKTICFISDEATKAYLEWMKERDYYLETSIKKTRYEKDINDNRVFPMSYHNARIMWENLLINSHMVKIEVVRDKNNKSIRKIKKDKGTRSFYHPHCLRSFFRSYLGEADLAEYLMGHNTLMTKVYRMKKPEDLANDYNKVMNNVTIFEVKPDLTETTKEIEQLKKDKQDKDKLIQELLEKQRFFELRMQGLENALNFVT